MSETVRKKTSVVFGAVGVIAFAVYCLFVFLVFGVKDPTIFWMSFGFMTIAFISQAVAPVYIFRKYSTETAFFGIPIASLGIFYLVAELFASLVFMLFQSSVSWKAALLVQVALLAAYVIALIVSVSVQSSVQDASMERRNEAVVFKAQFVDVQTLIDRVGDGDAALRKALEHLAETVRYSDPFGRGEPMVQQVEARITQRMNDLEASCAAGDSEGALGVIAELENLFMERRRKLMLVK